MNNVKKSIGWCDWTINPVKGLCPVGCSYCYARRAYGRNCNATFKDKSIRYDHRILQQISQSKPGDRIFVGSTIDLFHHDICEWTPGIISVCSNWHDRTFIFLTKCPENLPKEFPDNCWVGVSATNFSQGHAGCAWLSLIKAKVKFLSMEPLLGGAGDGNSIKNGRLGWQYLDHDINWLIIGQQTPVKQSTMPRIEWIKEIVDAADKAKIPVFLKSNLARLFASEVTGACSKQFAYTNTFLNDNGILRQEFPLIATEKEGK